MAGHGHAYWRGCGVAGWWPASGIDVGLVLIRPQFLEPPLPFLLQCGPIRDGWDERGRGGGQLSLWRHITPRRATPRSRRPLKPDSFQVGPPRPSPTGPPWGTIHVGPRRRLASAKGPPPSLVRSPRAVTTHPHRLKTPPQTSCTGRTTLALAVLGDRIVRGGILFVVEEHLPVPSFLLGAAPPRAKKFKLRPGRKRTETLGR